MVVLFLDQVCRRDGNGKGGDANITIDAMEILKGKGEIWDQSFDNSLITLHMNSEGMHTCGTNGLVTDELSAMNPGFAEGFLSLGTPLLHGSGLHDRSGL